MIRNDAAYRRAIKPIAFLVFAANSYLAFVIEETLSLLLIARQARQLTRNGKLACRQTSKVSKCSTARAIAAFNLSLFLTIGGFNTEAYAKVSLAKIFADGMVLQRDAPIRIWGDANPNEHLTTRLAAETKSVTATAEGYWAVEFKELHAGGPYDLRVAGSDVVLVTNILIGDVYFCAGQSNMAKKIGECKHTAEEIQKSGDAYLRVFYTETTIDHEPSFSGQWRCASPSTVPTFSAVPYFLGRELRQATGVPIGIIDCAFPGSQIRGWISAEKLEDFSSDVTNVQLVKDSSLFNAVVGPLSGIGVRAFAWYQGETDLTRAKIYPRLFRALVDEWRKDWKRGDLPFYYVQLPNFGRKLDQSRDSMWAEFREAQSKGTAIKNCYMAIVYDSADETEVPLHPVQKKVVAHRLALLIKRHTYGLAVEADSPSPLGAERQGASIVVRFPPDTKFRCSGQAELRGFELSGRDRVYHRSHAEIHGVDIKITNVNISNPEYVRYAWADNPDANLFTSGGVPITGFRTDNFRQNIQSFGRHN